MSDPATESAADEPSADLPATAVDDPDAAPTVSEQPPPEGDPAAPLDGRQPVNENHPGREPGGADDPADDEVAEEAPINPEPGDPVLGVDGASDSAEPEVQADTLSA